jgi:AraC-like DNA-binding protein
VVLCDASAPFTQVDRAGIRQHKIRIPLGGLALSRDTVRALSATTLSPGHPVTALAVNYLQRLAETPDLLGSPAVAAMEQPTIELIRAVVETHLGALGASGSLEASLPLRILEFARAHLSDPDLGASRIAAEHHISLRTLYKVLAARDVTLSVWIRRRRLERCRDDLAGSGTRSIESVARRWGFVDMSSFSRAFRAEYGMSPREWRDSDR